MRAVSIVIAGVLLAPAAAHAQINVPHVFLGFTTTTFKGDVGVFAYHPGMVRSTMTEGLVRDMGGSMGERLKAAFAEGRDTSVERSVEKFMLLASGRGDFLNGRYIMSRQKEEDLLAEADEIAGSDRYKLRVVRP